MRKRSEEECSEWVEKNVRSDLAQASTSQSEREGVMRPAMLYGLETVALTKRQEA